MTTTSHFENLKTMINQQSDYAWGWHCNIAMSIFDEGFDHETANRCAARIMKNIFGVDTTKTPEYKQLEHIWGERNKPLGQQVYEEEKKLELGIIKSIQFGMADRNQPCLLMIVETLQGEALLVFEKDEIFDFVKQADVTNINNLVGKPCVVEVNNGILKYKRMFV